MIDLHGRCSCGAVRGRRRVDGLSFSLSGLPDGVRVIDAADLSPAGTIARETFAKKPPEGFPLNYTPQDVGLGPYTKASP